MFALTRGSVNRP